MNKKNAAKSPSEENNLIQNTSQHFSLFFFLLSFSRLYRLLCCVVLIQKPTRFLSIRKTDFCMELAQPNDIFVSITTV